MRSSQQVPRNEGADPRSGAAVLVHLSEPLVSITAGQRMTAQEKAAGMLPTPATASKTLYAPIIPIVQKPGNTDSAAYIDLQERFAKAGRKLTRLHRLRDGRVSYIVVRFGESQYHGNLHSVKTHLIAIEGGHG